MLWRTHFLTGAIAGLIIFNPTEPKAAALTVGIAGISALLPDMDDPNSWAGRMIPVIPRLIKTTIGHRGALHSLMGAVFITALAAFTLRFWHPQAYVYNHLVPLFVIGYISHLAADSLNPQGVPWLWPLEKHFGLPLMQTGGFLERLAIFPALLVLCGWLLFQNTSLLSLI